METLGVTSREITWETLVTQKDYFRKVSKRCQHVSHPRRTSFRMYKFYWQSHYIFRSTHIQGNVLSRHGGRNTLHIHNLLKSGGKLNIFSPWECVAQLFCCLFSEILQRQEKIHLEVQFWSMCFYIIVLLIILVTGVEISHTASFSLWLVMMHFNLMRIIISQDLVLLLVSFLLWYLVVFLKLFLL